MNDLVESAETLPASDRRDQFVRELDAMCRDLVQTVHRLRAAQNDEDDRMIGRLEERVFTMTDAIHRIQRTAYLDEEINIAISHTVDGLPIRVNVVRRMPLWGF